MLLQPDIYRS